QVLGVVRYAGLQGVERHVRSLPGQQRDRVQGVLALGPVARAELVRLEGVEDPQDLLGVTADGAGGHHGELDLVVLVHDEHGALGVAVLALDAEVAHQLVLRVRHHRERQVAQVLVVLAPGVVDELRVTGEAEDLGVAVGELVVQLAEGGDLGGAHEGEVLGPRENDLPLALVGLVVDRLELLALLQRDAGGQFELGELVTDSEHALSLQRRNTRNAVFPMGWTMLMLAQGALISEIATLGRVDRGELSVTVGKRRRQPSLAQLRAFAAVAEHLHFRDAAAAIGMSQPALSGAVSALEETLGVALVERTTRKVLLSPAGERLAARAKAVLEDVGALIEEAEALRAPFTGVLRLGVIPTVAPYLLPTVL